MRISGVRIITFTDLKDLRESTNITLSAFYLLLEAREFVWERHFLKIPLRLLLL